MKIGYLHCFSGISGDMFLGALVDAGVSPSLLQETVSSLNIGAEIRFSRVDRSGISATKVDIFAASSEDHGGHANGGPGPQHSAQGSTHQHSHTHTHSHSPEGTHAHSHRSLSVIHELIEQAPIGGRARQLAKKAFDLLGRAESRIHDVPLEAVHFHEVGAVDAIADIVCSAVASEALGIDKWICSPLNVGGGMVKCAHGIFPVPAPATLDLLKDAPIYSSGIHAELVTPTGAAILRALGCEFGEFPGMRVHANGYGAGNQNPQGHPNVLRLSVGESSSAGKSIVGHSMIGKNSENHADSLQQDIVTVLETAIDDLNPQATGYVIEQLLEEGALDVLSTPVQMKKHRPGSLLTILCLPKDALRLRDLVFKETSTLGIRIREERRDILPRRLVRVSTPWGDVRLKEGRLDGVVVNLAPEYEDCRKIAKAHKLPLKQVMQAVVRLCLDLGNEDPAPRLKSTSEAGPDIDRQGLDHTDLDHTDKDQPGFHKHE